MANSTEYENSTSATEVTSWNAYSTSMAILAGINIFLAITASLGNTLILIALHKVTSINPPTKLLFRCLAVTDLFVGLISQPLYLIHSTSWVLTLTLTSLFFLPRLHSLFALCDRSHHSNHVLLACCFSLSSFYMLSAHHSALEKPVWRRQIYSYMYLGMQSSKQGIFSISSSHVMIYWFFFQFCYKLVDPTFWFH